MLLCFGVPLTSSMYVPQCVCAVLRGAADLIRADYPEIFCEFSDHTQSFGYDTSLITELLNSWGYVGRNWGDGNGHFVRFVGDELV